MWVDAGYITILMSSSMYYIKVNIWIYYCMLTDADSDNLLLTQQSLNGETIVIKEGYFVHAGVEYFISSSILNWTVLDLLGFFVIFANVVKHGHLVISKLL